MIRHYSHFENLHILPHVHTAVCYSYADSVKEAEGAEKSKSCTHTRELSKSLALWHAKLFLLTVHNSVCYVWGVVVQWLDHSPVMFPTGEKVVSSI